nr:MULTISPECIES: class I SAM-dependent methyltransferase [unclassified Methanosarcina]
MVGCRTGKLSLIFAEMGHKVTGIDISRKMLKTVEAKAKARRDDVTFGEGDAENPPFEPDTFEPDTFEPDTFDVFINRSLLWTLPYPDTAVTNWKKVLNLWAGISSSASPNVLIWTG